MKKRKELWDESKDIVKDRELTESIAEKILSTKELLNEIDENPHRLIECCFYVVNKKRQTVPFFFNDVQKDFIDKLETLGRSKPIFVLKGRQQGFTTLITAIQLCHAIIKRNFSGFTVADREDNTKAIFNDKAKNMYNDLPKLLKPKEKYNSANELYFDELNSSWRVASATSNLGRSRTLSFIHYSELAFYKCPITALQCSLSEAATEDAIQIFETTANGFNDTKSLWDSGSCHNLFYEWWRTKEYVSTEYNFIDEADSWLEKRLQVLKEKGLSREQLAWYAKKYSNYIDKSSIRQEYPCTPEEAFIVSGDCIFDKDIIANRLSGFNEKHISGEFTYKKEFVPITGEDGSVLGYEERLTDIVFEPDPEGPVKIVEEPYSVKMKNLTYKKPYVIGADTAGEGKDYFAAKVIDNTTGKCVATLHKQKYDEDIFAEQLYCIGTYYNNAFIAVEINLSQHPAKVLHKLGYENQYFQKYSNNVITKGPDRRYGFMTTIFTKPLMISNLVTIMREHPELETDRQTLRELSTYIRLPNGKSGGASGSHDDLVMASAIAHYVAQFYPHEMQIIDTGSDILDRLFKSADPQPNQFMEW